MLGRLQSLALVEQRHMPFGEGHLVGVHAQLLVVATRMMRAPANERPQALAAVKYLGSVQGSGFFNLSFENQPPSDQLVSNRARGFCL